MNLPPQQAVPRHVAIIMDGNGRWARSRFLPRTAGHKQGVDTTRRVIEFCSGAGVEVLTLFAFSSENWRRPKSEVSTLMELFVSALKKEARKMAENNIRLKVIGETEAFPEGLRGAIADTEAITANSTGMQLLVAANYGGQWDIAQAVRGLAADVKAGRIEPSQIDDALISARLTTAGLPDPDLFVRTGGELRISNFLMWQLAYTELYFTPTLWPDFKGPELREAFSNFASRQRRFGKTGEQVEGNA